VLQLSYFVPFLRQKSLAGYNHHPSQQPTLSLSAPDSASTSPCTTYYYPFLACSQLGLLSCQACCSLPSITSPAPCPHSLHPLSMSTWCGAYWIGAYHSVRSHGMEELETRGRDRGVLLLGLISVPTTTQNLDTTSASAPPQPKNNERQLDNG
jgi:hypothetical protein